MSLFLRACAGPDTATDLDNLYAAVTSNSISPVAREYLWHIFVPFELGVLDKLSALVARCKRKVRKAARGRGRVGRRCMGGEGRRE